MTRDAFRFFTGLAGATLAVMGALMLMPTSDEAVAEPGAATPAITTDDHFAIVGVRLFDGESVLEQATVVVDDGLVAAVGPRDHVDVPDGATIVRGADLTALPGLVDSHVHAFGDALEQSAVFGVTTVLDHFTDPEFVRRMRQEQDDGRAGARADLFSAGVLVTKEGGHGTQYGFDIPTFDVDPDKVSAAELRTAAREFVDARVAEGSDWIKIVYDRLGDPSGKDAGQRPHLGRVAVAALIDAAHAAGQLAVVHITEREAAREVLEDGADGLVHAWIDEPIDDALVDLARKSRAFVIPTLTVLESVSGTAGGAPLAADDELARFLPRTALGSLRRPFEAEPDPSRLEVALGAVGALHRAGVPILAGTDAPNPGTAYGVSMIRELELLIRAGLAPTEALAAATATPMASFGLGSKLGRLVAGAPADLLLVAGDPTTDVHAMRDIVAVWKRGSLVPRTPVPDEVSVSSALDAGIIGSFDTSEGQLLGNGEQEILEADQGFGWAASVDARMGGTSTVTLRVEEGALVMDGEIRDGFAFPWAGTIYFPGSRPMEPTDLSGVGELVLRARGDGGSYRLMVFSPSIGQIPAQQGFQVTEEWTEYRFDLQKLGGDRRDISALSIAAGPAMGPFHLEIDDVELLAK
ncbi:MAG: CIA30 family protein [Thermoanaerobaculia bacterium]|nr:CIA30 family protein [Thermoanaerobaculia bacterium]